MSGTLAPLARQLISTEAAMKTAALTLGQALASASTKSAINAASVSISRGFAVPGMEAASLALGQTLASASTKSAINAASWSISRGFAVPGVEAAALSIGQTLASANTRSAVHAATLSAEPWVCRPSMEAVMKAASLSLGQTLASASTKSAVNAAAGSLSRGSAVFGMEAVMKTTSLLLGQTLASASAKSAINAGAVSLSLTASVGGLSPMMKAALGSASALSGFAASDTVIRGRGFGVVASRNRHIVGDLRSRQKSVDMAANASTGETISAAKPPPETDKEVDGSGPQVDQWLVDHLPAIGFFVMIALGVGGIGEAYVHGGWAEGEFATGAWIAVVLAYVSIWRSGGFAGRNR